MYKFGAQEALYECPVCNLRSEIEGRMFEDVDPDERRPVLLYWHLGCGCVISTDKYERFFSTQAEDEVLTVGYNQFRLRNAAV